MNVVEVSDGGERSAICERVLRALPEWFGLEEPLRQYIREVAELPTFAVREDAFLSLKQHTPSAAEIFVMGVQPERQGRGLGTALMDAAEKFMRAHGIEYLQVKTLGPSHPSKHYARTRRFYESRGFRPLEELNTIWGESNPCLIMVKRLD